MLRQFWLRQCAVGDDDEARRHVIAAVGADPPELFLLVPLRSGHSGLENRELVEIVLLGDVLAVRVNLRALGVVARRHLAHLVKQRDVVVGGRVAGDAGITIPVPGPADVGAALDDADALDAALAQACGRQQGGESAADAQDLDRVGDRCPLLERLSERVGLVLGEIGVVIQVGDVLGLALRPVAEPQITLFGELLLDVVVVGLRLVGRRLQRVEIPHARWTGRRRFRSCHGLGPGLGIHSVRHQMFPAFDDLVRLPFLLCEAVVRCILADVQQGADDAKSSMTRLW